MARVLDSEGIQSVLPSQEGPVPYQRIDAPAAAFGAQEARGLENLGHAGMEVSKYFNDVAADNATNEFQSRADRLVRGDPTKTITGPDGQPAPDLGYLGTQGRAALDARPQLDKQIDELAKETAGGLQTPDQRVRFDSFVNRYRGQYLSGVITTHADRQAQAWYKQVDQGNKEGAASFIVADPLSEEQFKHGQEDMRAAFVKPVQRAGGGQKEVAQAIDDADRHSVETRVTALLPTNPVKAKEIWDQHRELMATAPNYLGMTEKLDATVDKVTAQQDAMKYLGRVEDPMQPGAPMVRTAEFTPGQGASSNNLGNVKTAEGARTNTAQFEQPATPQDGVTLAANNLRSNYQGLTLQQIGEKWAPPSENNTAQWVKNVSTASGLPADQVPDLNNAGQLKQLLTGITVAEKGGQDRALFSDAVLVSGIDASLGGQSPRLTKANILMDQAQVLSQIDHDYANDPRKARLIKSEVNQQYSIAKMAQQAQQLAAQDSINRTVRSLGDFIYKDPTADIEPLIQANPQLSQDQVEHAREYKKKVLQERLNGMPGDYGPKYSDVQQRILGAGPDRIVNQEQLLGLVGTGELNPEGYRQATKLLEDINKPGAEADKILQSNFYTSAKKAVTLEFEGYESSVSPERRAQWDQALPVLNTALAQGRAKGMTNSQLMDPANKDSVWGSLKPFLPTPAETMKANIDRDAKASEKSASVTDWKQIKSLDAALAAYERREITRDQAKTLWDQNGWGKSTSAGPQVPMSGGSQLDVSDLRVNPGTEGTDEAKWDKRSDGSSKGHGFLGLLRRPDGGVSSEISVGIDMDGQEVEIPTMVPTLTRDEVNALLKLDPQKEKVPQSIIDKAVKFARSRKAAGKSLFAGPDESPK